MLTRLRSVFRLRRKSSLVLFGLVICALIYIVAVTVYLIAFIHNDGLMNTLWAEPQLTSTKKTLIKIGEKRVTFPTSNVPSNPICRPSKFMISHDYCCIHQHHIARLKKLGFSKSFSQSFYYNSLVTRFAVASYNNPQHFACYGLTIHGTSSEIYRMLRSIFDKTQVFTTIRDYCDDYGLSYCDFLPVTYHMNVSHDRIAFFKDLECDSQHVWIFKENLHEGKGVHIITDTNDMRQLFLSPHEYISEGKYDCGIQPFLNKTLIQTQFGFEPRLLDYPMSDESTDDNTDTSSEGESEGHQLWRAKRGDVIAQEFIGNPLLLRGHKFHVRAFFMVPKYSKPQIVLYAGMICIISAMEYNNEEISRSNAITNRAVSKKTNVGKSELYDWVWNAEQLQNHLNVEYNNSGIGSDWVSSVLEPRLQQIGGIAWRAARHRGSHAFSKEFSQRWTTHYEFMAMDTLITDDFEVKLMEVQCGPASSFIPRDCSSINANSYTNTRWWACLFGERMAGEMVDIAIEVALHKAFMLPIEKLRTQRYFKTVVWDK